jgi:tRNA A-37 threonylcarbamoyl transferase component Bud32
MDSSDMAKQIASRLDAQTPEPEPPDDSWTGMPPADDADDPLIGTTLSGTYVVLRLLSEGGMGRIYEARHTRIERQRVAIKVLRPELAQVPEVHARFRREAEAAAAISHPNVVALFDVDRTPQGWPYLVSELLVGVDLSEYLERFGRLCPVTAIHIGVQVCDALQAAHQLGVVHRDVKPQNVFLVGDFSAGPPLKPMVKVLDFGLSRFLDASDDSSLTRAGVVMGTPSYMAPEQARGLRADHRADIYGAGALVYAMLTGRPPFNEVTPQLTILAVMDRDPVRPRALEPAISDSLELAVQRAMAKEPADRYPDMASLKSALEPLGLALPSASRRAGPEPALAPPGGGSRLRLEAEADTVRLARPRLVSYSLLAAASAGVLLATMLAAIAVFTGWLSFSTMLLVAVGTALTPAVLLVRRVRRDVWSNSAKVLALLERVRDPLMAAVVAVGWSALTLHFIDGVVASDLFAKGAGIAWPGWNLLFPLVAAIAAGGAIVRRRLHRDEAGRAKRLLLGPGLSALVITVAGGVLYGGLAWWAAVAPARAGSGAGVAQRAPRRDAAPQPAVAREPAPPAVPARATANDAELGAAIGRGVEGLLPLSRRYPEDPDVLRALTLALASRPTGRADAMAVARRWLLASPDAAHDKDLRLLVLRGAETPGETSKLAFELMAENMGAVGPDLLYEVQLTRPEASKRAGAYLDQPKVRAKASRALAIAYQLRRARSCKERLPLLERAAHLGDERTMMVLLPLVTGTKRGCGKRKNLPCPGACAAFGREYRAAIKGIADRIEEHP